MSDQAGEITWDETARERFEQLIGKVPEFLRDMAREKVTKEANRIVSDEDRNIIVEKDMVDAFFIATPFGFHGPLKTDMEALNIDYEKYGHPK